jgi:hypothetical protein
MNDAHDMDDAAWWQTVHEAEAQLVEDQRSALLRVAQGKATFTDAVLLAASLNHTDIFGHIHENSPNATDIEDDQE